MMKGRKNIYCSVGGCILAVHFYSNSVHLDTSLIKSSLKLLQPHVRKRYFNHDKNEKNLICDFDIMEDDEYVIDFRFSKNECREQVLLKMPNKSRKNPFTDCRYKPSPFFGEKLIININSKVEHQILETSINRSMAIMSSYFKRRDVNHEENMANCFLPDNVPYCGDKPSKIPTPCVKDFKNAISRFTRSNATSLSLQKDKHESENVNKNETFSKKENIPPQEESANYINIKNIENSKDLNKPATKGLDESDFLEEKNIRPTKTGIRNRKRKTQSVKQNASKVIKIADEGSESVLRSKVEDNKISLDDLLSRKGEKVEKCKSILFIDTDETQIEDTGPNPEHVQAVRAISAEGLLTYLQKFEGELKKILHGKVECERHSIFKQGGKIRGSLVVQEISGLFTNEQDELISKELIRMFCSKKSKYFDYVTKVLIPESMVMIYAEVNNIDRQEADGLLKEHF